MSDKEVLEKAIQKAIDGGWDILSRTEAEGFIVRRDAYDNIFISFTSNPEDDEAFAQSNQEVIFNHDFAKALWSEVRDLKDVQYVLELGKGEVTTPIYRLNMPLWKWHLQQMVTADDPIAYLGENL